MMKSFGPLSGIYTAPARGGTPSSLIVIMHGWGADAQDLADLAYPMSLRFPGAAFFVPNAPEVCSMNPMGASGSTSPIQMPVLLPPER